MSYIVNCLRLMQLVLGFLQSTLLKWGAAVGRKRIIKPRFWVLMMTALVLVFTCVYISQGNFIAQQEARIQELEAEYAQKLGDNQLLERKIAFSKTDAYVERVAHDQLGLLKSDEIRFVASGSAADTSSYAQ